MPYMVELPINEVDFTERMNRMRAWLDHRRVQSTGFRVSGAEPSGCRIQFDTESEAEAFAREFGGQVLGAVAGMVAGAARPAASSS